MASKHLTLNNFLACSFQKAVDLWEQSAAGWDRPQNRSEHGDAYVDRQVAAYKKRADEARASRDAAPVKIIAVYADGHQEVFG